MIENHPENPQLPDMIRHGNFGVSAQACRAGGQPG